MIPITVVMANPVIEVEILQSSVLETVLTTPVEVVVEVSRPAEIQTVLPSPVEVVVEMTSGGRGMRGPQGTAGSVSAQYVAGENLSAGRCIVVEGGEAFYFQKDNPTHAGRACGITISSALTGSTVSVQKSGDVEDVSFATFDTKLLWVGLDGELQETVPTTGLLQKAGIGIGSNKVTIDFSQQIILQ